MKRNKNITTLLLVVGDNKKINEIFSKFMNCVFVPDTATAKRILLATDDAMVVLESDSLQEIKELSTVVPHLTLVVMSHNREMEFSAIESGAYEFIHCPCNKKTIVARINQIYLEVAYKNYLRYTIGEYKESLSIINEKNKRFEVQAFKALAKTIDAKDEYTNGHSERVAIYTRIICSKLGLSEREIDIMYYAALLHDIGKIGVSNSVLRKSGKLTEEEYAIMQNHPLIGYDILSSITEYPQIAEGARWHHERWDGNGYPDKLKREDIPLAARIIAIADSFDAITSNRSYRPASTPEKAIEELLANAGTQFDPSIIPVAVNFLSEYVEMNTSDSIILGPVHSQSSVF